MADDPENVKQLLDWLMYWQFRCFDLEKRVKELEERNAALTSGIMAMPARTTDGERNV